MIKLTSIIKASNSASLILIPGGPGLSSLTIRAFDELQNHINLYYVDFPGTNNNPYLGKKSFRDLCLLLKEAIQTIPGDKMVLGHSFGGIFASALSIDLSLTGLICLGTPLSNQSINAANENYGLNTSTELKEAEAIWISSPSDQTFKNWLSNYNNLYFNSKFVERGKNLLLGDPSSSQFFLDNSDDIYQTDLILGKLQHISCPKLYIAGENDGLLPANYLAKDAELGGFEYIEISNANHFMMIDSQAETNKQIQLFIKKNGGKDENVL